MKKRTLRTGNCPTKYTEDIIIQAVNDYLSGIDEYDIAKKLKCNPQTVKHWVGYSGHLKDIRRNTIGYNWDLIKKKVK